jgi:hypothetical protein
VTPDRRTRILAILRFSAAVTFIVAAYLFFASYGKYWFGTREWDWPGGRPGDAYYASLAEGFRRGTLSMAHRPDPQLMAMANPYDYAEREKNKVPYLWDASYLNGRYYLYFSPLPALIFYLPYGLLYHHRYPADQCAAAVFACWGFIMAALFLRRALAGRKLQLPLWLWVVVLGLGNVIPVVIVFSRIYEVAALCGMAMTATWAWSLLRFLESPRTSRLLWASLWLALAIAARPHLGVLLPVFAFAVLRTRREDWLRAALTALVPLGAVAVAMLAYNYARFHNPLEFGIRYQLEYFNMADYKVCSCGTPREALRLVNTASLYVHAPVVIGGEFPFAHLTVQNLDQQISFNAFTDRMAGLAFVAPLALIGSLFAFVLAVRRETDVPGTRAGLFVVAAGWMVLLGLSTCWYASARYAIDFMMLIAAGAIVCLESALSMLESAGVRMRLLRAVVITVAVASILVGTLLGFTGENDPFKNENPALYNRIAGFFQ